MKKKDRGPFVSRGGIKLQYALQIFAIDPQKKVCLDVGASTGGFTDCLLQHGAEKVYAVDVGYGQFDWKLRKDPRVVLLERKNFRTLPKEAVPEWIAVATVDVSFISLKLIFPVLKKFLAPGAPIVALAKPQFEVGAKEVGKKGVVRESKLHQRVIEEIQTAGQKEGWEVQGVTPSPLLGAEGNQEFFILFSNSLTPRQGGDAR